ncbi:MAG TPA: formyltransferase family protein [Phycisphaerae bacterium]|nr:formyltransferase family protein [Phycisphaerae bacterium]
MISVVYTGRPALDACRAALGDVAFVPLGSRCDLGVSIGGSHIFTVSEINLARCGIVNLHFAPLPTYRGRYSAGHALRNGDPFFGVTLHYVDAGIDTGPIIGQRLFAIDAGETVGSLRARAFDVGVALFESWAPRLLDAARQGKRVTSWRQDESKARYYNRASLGLLA